MRAVLLLFVALLAAGAEGHELTMQPFGADSLREIRQVRRDKAFILVHWSANCADCRAQFAVLRDMARESPRVPLILVSTDGAAAARNGHALEEFGLDKEDLWAFDGADAAVRRSVDTAWDGRAPRTYLYDASHARQVISGRLERWRLQGWIRQVHAQH